MYLITWKAIQRSVSYWSGVYEQGVTHGAIVVCIKADTSNFNYSVAFYYLQI